MAASLSVIAAKDGNSATINGGIQALDTSGAGSGPFTLGHVIVDGLAGVNLATVKAASTAPVATDPALVVALSPNGLNPNGQAISANSAPFVGASDWIEQIGGDVAAGSADSGKPVKIGGIAKNAEPTALTTGQRAQCYTDLVGKLITLPYANPENFVQGAIISAMTGTTSTQLIAAPAAGLRNYITQITVSNSHATVSTDVAIQDGSAGATLYTIPAAAAYGGAAVTFTAPLRQPTTATGIFAQNVTTGSNIKVSATGYKGV